MTSYAFKEWLTFEEAAEWLSEFSGSTFSAVDIERAAMESRILTHYWPTDGSKVGVFSFDKYELFSNLVELNKTFKLPCYFNSNLCLHEAWGIGSKAISQCDFIARAISPVPIISYKDFVDSKNKKSEFGERWYSGISVFIEDQEIPYGLYLLSADFKPLCLLQCSFQILIHIEDLVSFNSELPIPKRRKPHEIILVNLGCDDDGVPFDQAYSSVEWSFLPEKNQLKDNLDKASLISTIDNKSELLQTLAFSIHLIADLAEKLDAYQVLPSEKLKLKHGAKPNIKNIATALSEKAKALNYKGHGFGAEGFRKKLSKALNEIQ